MSYRRKKKPKILMCFVKLSTFTVRDIEILSTDYQVESYHFNTHPKWKLPFAFLRQGLFLLFRGFSYKVIITQSSGYLSFLPIVFGKIFKIPVVIIAIGTDCAKLPEINYGAFSKKMLSYFTRFSFLHAALILPVHKSLAKSLYTYDDVLFKNQGIKSFCPSIKTEIVEVVNGYNVNKWKLTNQKRIPNSFLTVTVATDPVGYYRKGIDLILFLAQIFPTYHFTIVGNVTQLELFPKNIKCLPNVHQNELVSIYNEHEYYLQLSMFEGFPNALCEAMLCGCIPIGSSVAGIPDIIGDAGFILNKKNKNDLKRVVETLKEDTLDANVVRNRIAENFPLERRVKELRAELKKIIKG